MGETDKNPKHVFDPGEASAAVLLFEDGRAVWPALSDEGAR